VLAETIPNEHFEKTDELLGKVIRDLRTLSHNLNSNRLQELGIVESLRSLLLQLEKTGKYSTAFHEANSVLSFMNNNNSLILYRMVQEVLNNIIKHAYATHIIIDITIKSANCHILRIQDNGKGFDTKILEGNKTGIGLQNIFTRAKMIDAEVNIQSSEKDGTAIIFEITNQPILK
jgi:signal transduction histidine kinase